MNYFFEQSANYLILYRLVGQNFYLWGVQNTINLIEIAGNLEFDYQNCSQNDLPKAIDYVQSKAPIIKPTAEAFDVLSESFATIFSRVFMNEYLGNDTT